MNIVILLITFSLLFGLFRPAQKLKPFDVKATQPLRGLLALMIVMHHSSLHFDWHMPDVPDFLSPFSHFQCMGSPVVSVFFFLSGYGLAASLKKKGKAYLSGFIPKRMGPFFPELVILTLVAAVIIMTTKGVGVMSQMNDFFLKGMTILPFSWFLFVIGYVYIAFYVSAIIGNAKIFCTGVIFAAFIIFYMGLANYAGYGYYWYGTVPAVILGYGISAIENRIDSLSLKARRLILCILIGSCVMIAFSRKLPAYSIVEGSVYSLAVYSLIRIFGSFQWKWLISIGGISLYIYIIHGLAVLLIPKEMNPYVGFLTIVASSIPAAYLLKFLRHRITERGEKGTESLALPEKGSESV